jgi:hypothetical protein
MRICRDRIPNTGAACIQLKPAIALALTSRLVIACASRYTRRPMSFIARLYPNRGDIFKLLCPGHFQCF